MRSRDVARRLGVDASTVRRWARDYERYLSPTAQKAPDDDLRKPRVFTNDDLRLFWTIATAQERGVGHEEIELLIAGGELLEGELPEHPLTQASDEIELVPASTAMARIEALQDRVETLEVDLEDARQRLDQKNERVIELEQRLGDARSEIAVLEGRIETVKLETAVEVNREAAELRGKVSTLQQGIETAGNERERERSLYTRILIIVGVVAAVAVVALVLLALAGPPG
jgi:DNA-binding transcriptional MerR regulator